MATFGGVIVLLVGGSLGLMKLAKSRQLQKEREARRARRDAEARRRIGLD